MRYQLKVDLLEAGVSQRDLARFVGVADSTVTRWALYHAKPSERQQTLIALFLKMARRKQPQTQEATAA